MKPYFVTHKAFGVGLFVGVLPSGQWDIALSLTFFSVGLRQKLELDNSLIDEEIERLKKEYDVDDHLR